LIAKLNTPIHELAIKDRVGVVEELAGTVEESMNALSNIDVSEYPELKRLLQETSQAGAGFVKSISDTIYSMRSAAKMLESGPTDKIQEPESSVHEDPGDDTSAIDIQFQRRAQQSSKRGKDSARGHGDNDGPNSNKRRRTFANNGGSSFHHHPHSAKHAHVRRMQDAIKNGDQGFMHAMLTSLKTSTDWHAGTHDRHGRRTEASIAAQCELLVGCASRMSLYDIFVYFYSDDIDPNTGNIDDSVIVDDQRDIVGKQSEIQTIASGILSSNDYSNMTSCKGLLQLFHRNIEFDDIPQWEGASVTQVCLAEGTTVFVNLDELILTALQNEEDVEKLYDNFKSLVLEPHRCAEDLFYNQSPLDEDFVFLPQGTDRASAADRASNIDFNAFVHPTGVDDDDKDDHGQSNSPGFVTEDAIEGVIEECLRRDSPFNQLFPINFYTPEILILCLAEAAEVIQRGLELVFGDRPSPGFICGVKEAVLGGASLPGYCCLDAPYQRQGDNWGYAVSDE
jgi:hypothetical protein